MARIGVSAAGSSVAEMMDSARALEAAGFNWVTTGDRFDALVTAGAIATATKRVTIASCVTLLTRTPVQTVQACTGLDDLSGGRFVLGLGVGPDAWNSEWHGIDPARPAVRMAEYLRCFKAAWRSRPGAPANVDGEIFRVHNYVRGARSVTEDLPVLVGVVGPRNTRNAGEFADGVIFDIELPFSYVQNVGMPALLEGAGRVGKTRQDVTAGALLGLSVDADRAAARRRARHAILQHVTIPYYRQAYEAAGFVAEAAAAHDALLRDDLTSAVDAIPEAMVDALTLAGTPDEVRAAFKRWDELLDVIIGMSPRFRLPADEVAWAHQNAVRFLTDYLGRR